jgi:hypothetical protein
MKTKKPIQGPKKEKYTRGLVAEEYITGNIDVRNKPPIHGGILVGWW